MRILVVDDEAPMRLALEQTLPFGICIRQSNVESRRTAEQAKASNVGNTRGDGFNRAVFYLQHRVEKDIAFAISNTRAEEVNASRQLRPTARLQFLGVSRHRRSQEAGNQNPCSYKTQIVNSLVLRPSAQF